MADVFEATILGAAGFERPVAIKRVRAELSAHPAFGDMFINEARIASLLHHENIVGVVDFDRDEQGRYFLVMERVTGIDLRELTTTGILPFAVSAFIMSEVLTGLAYAHSLRRDDRVLGIVHRDITPHNIMVTWDGNPKIVDFGIAKAVAATGASNSGTLRGKLAYMSPEQAHGRPLDGRSDVFAAGVIFYELLAGQRLFRGTSEPEILSKVLGQPIASPRQVDPSIPEDLANANLALLERDPNHRLSARQAMELLLGCPSLTGRARLDLRELLRARFPGRAPKKTAGMTVPPMAAVVEHATQTTPSGAVIKATFTDNGEQVDRHALHQAAAARAIPMAAPSAAPSPPTSQGHPRAPSRGGANLWLWVLVAALAAVVAIAVAKSASGTGDRAAPPSGMGSGSSADATAHP